MNFQNISFWVNCFAVSAGVGMTVVLIGMKHEVRFFSYSGSTVLDLPLIFRQTEWSTQHVRVRRICGHHYHTDTFVLISCTSLCSLKCPTVISAHGFATDQIYQSCLLSSSYIQELLPSSMNIFWLGRRHLVLYQAVGEQE